MEPMNKPATEQIGILIVDDEKVVRESLFNWFRDEGYLVDIAAEGMEALRKLHEKSFDIVILDIKMPGMDGMELQKRLREIDQNIVIIIMTAYASVDTAVQALKAGAFDYVTKPIDPDDLSHLIRNAIEKRQLVRENLRLKEEIQTLAAMDQIVGESAAMQKVFKLVQTVADTDTTVMIRGESGTGKELVARAIHINSKRRYFPIIPINCGALPDPLVESELFGHERGAFTGAQFRRKGKLELAHGGTVFLDEIGDIGPKTQMDLLRVIETRQFSRLGGNATISADFRLLSATNRDMEAAVKAGTFREDLYYRLNVFAIALPALRERVEDLPPLVNFFIRKYATAMNKPFTGIEPGTIELLQKYPWPGNVRELQNAVERAMVIGSPPLIRSEDFPLGIASANPDPAPYALDDVEKQHIARMLDQCGGNVSQAAQLLQIDRATLYNKIKKYGLRK
jgi:DNA-binding NtrC family response regulator